LNSRLTLSRRWIDMMASAKRLATLMTLQQGGSCSNRYSMVSSPDNASAAVIVVALVCESTAADASGATVSILTVRVTSADGLVAAIESARTHDPRIIAEAAGRKPEPAILLAALERKYGELYDL